MIIRAEILSLSTARENTIEVESTDGINYTCHLVDESQWDLLYDHLMSRINLEVLYEREDGLYVVILN